jgi:hypothetical protein
MGREIIILKEEEILDQPVLALFDDKLRRVLTAKNNIVALCIRPEMECSTGLLEWLEAWNTRLRNVNKKFFIVPATATQLECLEVSHPDLDLHYASSLDQLPAGEPQIPDPEPPVSKTEPVIPVVVAEAGNRIAARAVAAHQATMMKQATEEPVVAAVISLASEETKAVHVVPDHSDFLAPKVHMKAGNTVRLAGEYVCSGCRISRMWLKGDKATNCENPECRNPSAGWNLTCELF